MSAALERLFFTFRSITKGDHDFDGIADEAAAELAAKDAEIVRLKAEREFYKNNASAWAALANHQEFCAVCGEDVDNCEDGSLLRSVANVIEDIL